VNLSYGRGRPKRVRTPEEEAERLESKRASGRERSRRYYKRLREERAAERVVYSDHYTALCSHDCGCQNEIVQPTCRMCDQGLCNEFTLN
jgi:hypothetical protein